MFRKCRPFPAIPSSRIRGAMRSYLYMLLQLSGRTVRVYRLF
ncbi:MAG: hypothetical protein AB7U21_10180 [Methanomethylovorans sp.]